MRRLANISIDLDGRDFVFRVRLGDSLHLALTRTLDSMGVQGELPLEPVVDLKPKSETVAQAPVQPPIVERVAAQVVAAATPATPPPRNTHGKTTMPPKPAVIETGAHIDADIRRLYVGESLSVARVAEIVGLTHMQVTRRMDKLGIARRSASEASTSRWAGHVKADPFTPKAKPIKIPDDAPRKPVPLAPTEKLSGKDAINKIAAASMKQRGKLGLSPADQQALVEQHFKKGGAVSVCPKAHAFGSEQAKSNIGGGFTNGGRVRR